jgi:hypothetical protein
VNQPQMSSPYAALPLTAHPRRPLSAIIVALIGLFAGCIGLLWHGSVLMVLIHSVSNDDPSVTQGVLSFPPTISAIEQAGLLVLSIMLLAGSIGVFAFAGGAPRTMTTYGGLALLFNLAAFCYTVGTVDPSTLPVDQPISASERATSFYLYESACLIFGCLIPSLALIVFTRPRVRQAFTEAAQAQTLLSLPFAEDPAIRDAAGSF